jgi:hypothetical protein
VRDAGERLLREMDRELSELTAARAAMASTLAAWDAKLARTPDGAAAHLLADLPKLPPRRQKIAGGEEVRRRFGSSKPKPS